MNEPVMWEEDLNERYLSGGFSAAGGNLQSLMFARAAFDMMWSDRKLARLICDLSVERDGRLKGTTVYDYGCAEGDGTAYLAQVFPASKVVGVDCCIGAIARARVRWPTLQFEVGDIREPKKAGIIFSSHTIEHTQFPDLVMNGLLESCSILIVIFPPLKADCLGGHTGGMAVEEWLVKVKRGPVFFTSYNTLRVSVDEVRENTLMPEGNVLQVYKGDLSE